MGMHYLYTHNYDSANDSYSDTKVLDPDDGTTVKTHDEGFSGFDFPSAIYVDRDWNIYIGDGVDGFVKKFVTWGSSIKHQEEWAFHNNNVSSNEVTSILKNENTEDELFVGTDYGVQTLNPMDGSVISKYSGITKPISMAYDGKLHCTEEATDKIHEIYTPGGTGNTWTVSDSSGALPAEGDYYVSDSTSPKLMKYDGWQGSLQTSTTASNASGGCYGDIHRSRAAARRSDSKMLLVTGTDDGWLVVWDGNDSTLPVLHEINVDGSSNNRITDISFTPWGRAYVNTKLGETYAVDIPNETVLWSRSDISTEDKRQISAFSRRGGRIQYGDWNANRLSGKCTKNGSGVENANVFGFTSTELLGYAKTDSNGDWKMTVMQGDANYHVAAQYDDGTNKHNTKSYPYIPNS